MRGGSPASRPEKSQLVNRVAPGHPAPTWRLRLAGSSRRLPLTHLGEGVPQLRSQTQGIARRWGRREQERRSSSPTGTRGCRPEEGSRPGPDAPPYHATSSVEPTTSQLLRPPLRQGREDICPQREKGPTDFGTEGCDLWGLEKLGAFTLLFGTSTCWPCA